MGMGFLASGLLSNIDGFAFFGESMGSVFTDSVTCQYQLYEETGKRDVLSPRTLRSVAFKIRGSLLASFTVSPEVGEVVLRLNLKSSPCGSTPVSCDSSSSLALSFRFAPVRMDALWSFNGAGPSSPPSGGDWKTDILLILILALLSLRFFRVSRLMDKAGFGPSWSCSTASSVWLGWDWNFIGPSSSKCATGGGPKSGDWLSGSSKTSLSSSALFKVSKFHASILCNA